MNNYINQEKVKRTWKVKKLGSGLARGAEYKNIVIQLDENNFTRFDEPGEGTGWLGKRVERLKVRLGLCKGWGWRGEEGG